MGSQRTSWKVKPVSAGLAKQVGRMVEDAALKYRGGVAKMELVKGDPDFAEAFYQFCDERAALRAETLAIAECPLWKTIKLGTHSVDELRQALIKADFKVGVWADDILGWISIAPEPTEVELVVVTVAGLGFHDGATRQEIYEKALSLGLHVCPSEVGPQLRLQYPDQPRHELLLVAMKPISDSNGRVIVFRVEHTSGSLWVNASYCAPVRFWSGNNRWVFCRK